jgi:hypothetical protein
MLPALAYYRMEAEARERLARAWLPAARRHYERQAHDYEAAAKAAERVERLQRARDYDRRMEAERQERTQRALEETVEAARRDEPLPVGGPA